MQKAKTTSANTLFVYGTLMRASGHPMAKKLQSQSCFIAKGWIAGKMYSLGSYPGVIPSSGSTDKVHGEVVRLANPAYSLAWIDDYEGCGAAPEPHAYERVSLPVRLCSGGQLEAWVYIYKYPVSKARHIPGGRFLRY